MIAFTELPEGVALLHVYPKKGALTGACLVECHHANQVERLHGARRVNVCPVCRTASPARPVKLLARIPAAALKAAPRQPVQASLF